MVVCIIKSSVYCVQTPVLFKGDHSASCGKEKISVWIKEEKGRERERHARSQEQQFQPGLSVTRAKAGSSQGEMEK